jgi:glyoxylase-like metal-dependent hydrolase (beta-lactamase superfamily II)
MVSTASMTELMTIHADDLRDRLERREPLMVLDVRSQQERDEWSIPGSVHVDAIQALKAGDGHALDHLDLPAETEVVTVCGVGKAALFAAEQLWARGIKARSLAGGMKAWSLAWNAAELTVPDSAATVTQIRRTGKGCLSYLIGSDDEAAVIDASVEPEVYMDLAAERGRTITHVLDTHIHADHISRSRLLAEQTGARLMLPANGRAKVPFQPLADGDVLTFGSARLVALHTPGHTPESMSYLLDGHALFTGDTLFLTGVGRPDLEASANEARNRARLLWSSLQRLTALDPQAMVLPGHTSSPVAFDGKPVAATLMEIVRQVRAVRLPEEEFVETILSRLPPTPPNHAAIVALNETGSAPDVDPADLEAGANRCEIS